MKCFSSHDWPDHDCVTILRGVRDALKPTSRVLIRALTFLHRATPYLTNLLLDEFVLQHADRKAESDSVLEQAPEPLLPNYGVGSIRQYNLDLNMLVLLNGKQRTFEEFVGIGEKAGLRFVKLWGGCGDLGLVEFRLA